MYRYIALTAALSLLPAANLWSQTSTYSGYNSSSGSAHTSASYPVLPPNAPQHHASTLQEGILRGTASVMQAHYNGQVSHAQARILLAEARAREIQLRVTNMQAAQARRRLAAAERAELRQQKMENELLGQQLNAARIPLRYAEYRLSDNQLDRQTGEIAWPTTLRHETFAANTYVLEKLFAKLAEDSGSDARYTVSQIVDACERLEKNLRDVRKYLQLDADQYQQYVACQKFTLGLKYEAVTSGLGGSTYSLAAQ